MPIRPREQGKCWGCQEPWTPEHKFICKFRRDVHAMAVELDDWLAIEQAMEEENHSLLQTEVTEVEKQQPPQLLMLSTHAAKGTTSSATFSVVLIMGGKRGPTLIDSSSTDSFLDYTFASKCNCDIISSASRKVKVAGGGYLESSAETVQTPYFI
jgi:hypothetical protein